MVVAIVAYGLRVEIDVVNKIERKKKSATNQRKLLLPSHQINKSRAQKKNIKKRKQL